MHVGRPADVCLIVCLLSRPSSTPRKSIRWMIYIDTSVGAVTHRSPRNVVLRPACRERVPALWRARLSATRERSGISILRSWSPRCPAASAAPQGGSKKIRGKSSGPGPILARKNHRHGTNGHPQPRPIPPTENPAAETRTSVRSTLSVRAGGGGGGGAAIKWRTNGRDEAVADPLKPVAQR